MANSKSGKILGKAGEDRRPRGRASRWLDAISMPDKLQLKIARELFKLLNEIGHPRDKSLCMKFAITADNWPCLYRFDRLSHTWQPYFPPLPNKPYPPGDPSLELLRTIARRESLKLPRDLLDAPSGRLYDFFHHHFAPQLRLHRILLRAGREGQV
ncbi:hypothetical protein JCM8547_003806 [Rhodosporidiobolus lusitaniae]